MGYVIYLSSEPSWSVFSNPYGYWQGKSYTVQGEKYPFTYPEVTAETKVYQSKVRAEKMAEKLLERYGCVLSWRVEEVK